MNPKQWLNTALVLMAIYLSGYLIRLIEIDWLYEIAPMAVSFGAIWIVLYISKSKLSIILSIVELLAIPISGLAMANYEVIIEFMALTQAIILIIGGVYYGVVALASRCIESIRMGDLFQRSGNGLYTISSSITHSEGQR